MSDERHEEIRRLSSTLIERNPKVFQPFLFAWNSVKEHVEKSKITGTWITGTWAETVDIFSCASLLKRPICTFSTAQKKWFTFEPIMNTESCSSITTKKECRCPITLMYYDFYAQANHFNLLLPQGSCCSAPPPENTASSVSIDLSNTVTSYASAVKQISQSSPSVKLPSTSTKATGSKQPCQALTPYNTTASSSNTKRRVKKPSMSPKADPAKKSSINKPTPVCKRTTSKGPSSVKEQVPATTPTQEEPYSSSLTVTSSQISTDKPTTGKEPSSKQATTNTTTPVTALACATSTTTNNNNNHNTTNNKNNNNQNNNNEDNDIDDDNNNNNNNNNNNLNFEKMDVKEIKGFISARGVQVSTYRKPELIRLAKAVASMNLPTDPDFENDCIEECLIRRLTLPAGRKLTDPFQMISLSNDLSELPPFGLMDIFNHLIMSKADYDKSMLSSRRSFEEYNLCLNGHIQSLGVKTVRDLDGSDFFVFVAGVIPTQKEKTQEGEKLYRLVYFGFEWVCVLCILQV